MKKLLQITAAIGLLSIATSTNAAPSSGEWEAKLWNDSTGAYAETLSICIQDGANWYISSNFYAGIKGKWFSKGNDSHFISMPLSGAVSFDVSRINNGLLTGYYKTLFAAGTAGYYTVTLTYKGKVCPPYIPYTY